MKRTVGIIILLFTILNVSSFFIMKAKTPQYTVFTGAVHYPPDYLYYLSFITQGKEHWIYSSNLKSSETQSPEFLNWFYVLGGHIGSLFGLSSIAIYQLMVVCTSIVYLGSAYLLFSLVFPTQPVTRGIAYLLFLLSNAFPKITHSAAGWDFNFYYPFNNMGHPFVRLSNVPHHTLIQASILQAFVFFGKYTSSPSKKYLPIMAILGIILGSMQPLQWAIVTGILGLCSIFFSLSIIPSIVLGFSGLPFAIYIQQLYSGSLYTYMINWEKNQQVFISFKEFVTLHGPVMLVGLISIPLLYKKISRTAIPMLLYSTLAIGIFFSPIPVKIGVLNLRFLSIVPIAAVSYMCALLIKTLCIGVPAARRYPLMWFAAFCIIAITIPVTYAHVALGRPHASLEEVNTYLPIGMYELYETARKTIAPSEVTLVTPFFSQSFPGFVGRHVFVADAFGTLDFQRKKEESDRFLALSGTASDRYTWLKKNSISYIITYAWTPISDMPELRIVQQNDYAILYKVM